MIVAVVFVAGDAVKAPYCLVTLLEEQRKSFRGCRSSFLDKILLRRPFGI